MCRRRIDKKEMQEHNERPLPTLERDFNYSRLIDIHVDNTEKNFKFKIIFQYAFAGLAFAIIIALTILLIVFVNNFKTLEFSESETITALISGFSGYAASIVGILLVVLNYIFNKNDSESNNKIISAVLGHDEYKNKNSEESKPINTKWKLLDDSDKEETNNENSNSLDGEK